MERKYPRYFTNTDKTVWVPKYGILKNKGATLKFPGYPTHGGHSECLCDENVENGYWREVTEEELPLII